MDIKEKSLQMACPGKNKHLKPTKMTFVTFIFFSACQVNSKITLNDLKGLRCGIYSSGYRGLVSYHKRI